MQNEVMKKDGDFDEKAEQVRYWQSRPTWERFDAMVELSVAEYLRKHPDADPPTTSWDKAKVRVLPFPVRLERREITPFPASH